MTTIRLHDSMARAKREFVPLDPQNVRLYVCGPTVYDRAHIGNARPAVVFDVLFRLLRHTYGADHVTYVRNITDIDDKIIDRARERGVDIDVVTRETAQWFQDDMAALGCLAPTHQPRATEHVPGMIAMIAALITAGKAYEAEGHVLFEVGKFPDYGRLSGRSTDDMIAGARVEVAPWKRDPMDFVLWKPSTPDQPGWDSPWGRGRPGWHIECSAMSRAWLGADFDIHGGGADLMFPHHENEIAQSVCAHPGEGFARYWLHNGMVRVDGRKMSKSLGNFFTVQDKLAEGVPGEVIRLALLMTHYRDTLDLTAQRFGEAQEYIDNWIDTLSWLTRNKWIQKDHYKPSLDIVDALSDDINTALAVNITGKLAKYARSIDCPAHEREKKLLELRSGLELLGFDFSDDPRLWAKIARTERAARAMYSETMPLSAHDKKIHELLKVRQTARAARDFDRADAIRRALDVAGVVVMDHPGAATEWELTRHFDPAKLEGIDQ